MRKVTVTKVRLYSEERKRKITGNHETGTGQLKSIVKQKRVRVN
jgi:hypothetical protein